MHGIGAFRLNYSAAHKRRSPFLATFGAYADVLACLSAPLRLPLIFAAPAEPAVMMQRKRGG